MNVTHSRMYGIGLITSFKPVPNSFYLKPILTRYLLVKDNLDKFIMGIK